MRGEAEDFKGGLSADELQARPGLVNLADLDVDQGIGEADLPHDIFIQIGRDLRCPLRPGDPEGPLE